MSRGIYLIDSLASDALGLHDAAQRLEPLGSSAVSWLGTSAVSPAQDRTICLRDRVCAGALAGSGPSPRGIPKAGRGLRLGLAPNAVPWAPASRQEAHLQLAGIQGGYTVSSLKASPSIYLVICLFFSNLERNKNPWRKLRALWRPQTYKG